MNETESQQANDDDETTEQIVVADADEYNQSRRLKSIHKARDDVREAYRNVTRGRAPGREHRETREELATAVAFYGMELEPLMNEADWDGEIDKGPWPDVQTFIATAPLIPPSKEDSWNYIPDQLSMAVFSRLNEFAREAGLGVDLDDGTDEWEV
jgi:hypothetical protein